MPSTLDLKTNASSGEQSTYVDPSFNFATAVGVVNGNGSMRKAKLMHRSCNLVEGKISSDVFKRKN